MKDAGAWKTDRSEMYRKTILKRGCKLLPKAIIPPVAHESLRHEDNVFSEKPTLDAETNDEVEFDVEPETPEIEAQAVEEGE